MSHRLLVLTWHNVNPTWCFPAAPGAGARGLARQLRACKQAMNVVPLEEAARDLQAGRDLPPRAVALTFDDGYGDSHDVAVPLLRHLGLPATFFLVPGLLHGSTAAWWETVAWVFRCASVDSVAFEGTTHPLATDRERRSASSTVAELLKQRGSTARHQAIEELRDLCRPTGAAPGRELFLDWRNARDIARSGFAIGSHSSAHDILAREEPSAQRRDLADSRSLLEQELEVPVRQLAYPNGKSGDYDATTVAAAREAGYTGAWTTHGGRNSPRTEPFELRRCVLEPQRGLAAFATLASQSWRSRHQAAPVSDRRHDGSLS